MSLQSILDYQAIKKLPKCEKMLVEIDKKMFDNVYFVLMRKINDAYICLDNMDQEQLEDFDHKTFDNLNYKYQEKGVI